MFNQFGELFNKVNDFQAKMQELKRELSAQTVIAEAGGGMIKVTANGNREIVSIVIEKSVIAPEDAFILQDLIVAGVNKALSEADQLAKRRMEELTRSMLPGGLPGMDLSRFGL